MFTFFIIFSLVLGSALGSFLNCLAWRLYHGEGLWDRSHCPKCRQKISWYDNIPVLSFIILNGSCRHCHKKISWQYPLAELMVSLLFGLFFFSRFYAIDDLTLMQLLSTVNFSSLSLLRDWLAISFLSVIFIMDVKWYVVADEISITGAVLLLVINLALGLVWPSQALSFGWQPLLIAIFVGAGVFLLQYLLSRGTWVGSGDIRIGALIGALLSWPNVLVALFLSYLVGSIVAIGLVLSGKKKFSFQHLIKPDSSKTEMILPFGPFLAIGAVIAMLYGSQLINWYQGLIF